MSKGTLWGMIDAQPVYFPAVVNVMNAASLVFSVPTAAARAVVPDDTFELVESTPGTAHLVMAAHDYLRGGWGTGRTFDFGFRVRPVGAPGEAVGLLLHPTPMSPGFNREAAYRALGFPKTTGDIEAHYTDETVTFTLAADRTPDVVLQLPRVRSDVPAAPVAMVAYSCVGGETRAAPFEMDTPIGIADPTAVALQLGGGPVATILRQLGLPRAPDLAMWGEGASAVFYQPHTIPAPDIEATRGPAPDDQAPDDPA